MEIWKDVKGYEGLYHVSSKGNVKSLKYGKERILKAGVSSRGYKIVVLHINKKAKANLVHQLVAESFLGHTRCGFKLVVNHINYNKLDNRVENLEIVTNRENTSLKRFTSSSQYTGVGSAKQPNKWVARIVINKKLKHLGTFTDEIEAHNAYQKALAEIK